ncbi:MAG: hypothetical protein ACE5Q9_05040 [Nitrosopumilus sp.]
MVKFLESITNQFPELRDSPLVDITDHEKFSTLLAHINADYMNYDKVKRTDLYRLSMMIEDHAQRAYEPLVAVFETEHLYKYVEKRYYKIIENTPKTWVIGGFENPFFAPQTPSNGEILTCAGTSLQDTWIVISKYNGGLFGLVAEDIGGVEKGDWFKGFFTSKTEVIQKVLDEMNHIMMTNINFFDLESKETGL